MKAPVELYVDTISNEGRTGYTCDSKKIYYNFEKINKQWFDEFLASVIEYNTSSAMFTAGRYLGIISITFEKGGQELILMDLENNEEFAEFVVDQRDNPSEKERFMNVFHALSEIYDRDFNDFCLIEGLPE